MRSIIILITISLLSVCLSTVDVAAERFHDEALRCVVAIGETDSVGNWDYRGTGFLMYNNIGGPYIIVTAKHVLYDHRFSPLRLRSNTTVRVNVRDNVVADTVEQNRRWEEFELPTKIGDILLWTFHPDPAVDVAVRYFPSANRKQILKMKSVDIAGIPPSQYKSFAELTLGQQVIFFGFPLGLGLKGTLTPFVRIGMIANLLEYNKPFFIDGQAFSGSSGSPVYTAGQGFGGGERIHQPYSLIGLATAYRNSPIGIRQLKMKSSGQDSTAVFGFYENSGLAVVYCLDLVLETIDLHHNRLAIFYNMVMDSLNIKRIR